MVISQIQQHNFETPQNKNIRRHQYNGCRHLIQHVETSHLTEVEQQIWSNLL